MSANDIQEGGDHYKKESDRGNPQHWDLAIIYQWDPFQYQITKYVMRWKDKFDTPEKRLVDLKKARHFLDKYIENWETYDTGKRPLVERRGEGTMPPLDMDAIQTRADVMREYVQTNTQGRLDSFWTVEGYLGNGLNVYKCSLCKMEVQVKNLEEAYDVHPGCSLAHAHFAAP